MCMHICTCARVGGGGEEMGMNSRILSNGKILMALQVQRQKSTKMELEFSLLLLSPAIP